MRLGKTETLSERSWKGGRQREEGTRSIQRRSFPNNPNGAAAGSRDLSLGGHVAHSRHSAFLPLYLSPTFSFGSPLYSPPICPPPPPPFFRHEPCALKQLGGAAERERRRKEELGRTRKSKIKIAVVRRTGARGGNLSYLRTEGSGGT